MSLRRQALIITVAAMVVALLIWAIVSQAIFMKRFDRLEEREARQSVSRAVTALYSDLRAVNIAPGGDLTAGAVGIDGDGAYLRLGFDGAAMEALGLNFILFTAPGQPLYGSGWDAGQGSLLLPGGLVAQMEPGSPLMQPAGGQPGVTAIFMEAGGPLLASSYPARVATGGMLVDGTVVLARYLDGPEMARLSDAVGLPVTIRECNDPQLPDGVLDSRQGAGDAVPAYVRALDSGTIAGYGVLDDIYGQPAVVLQVDLPRDIHHQGQMALLYLGCAVCLVVVVTGLAGSCLVQRPYLMRVQRLSNGVVRVRTTGDLSQRVEVTGNDEMTTLEMSINSMLASLEKSQKELRESESQNRALVKGIPDLMYRIGMDGTLLEGRSAREGNILEPYRQIQGKVLYHPIGRYSDLTREVIQRGLDHMDVALRTGEAQVFEFQLPAGGRDLFYEVRMMASEKEGELLCVVFDVTQRHAEAEKKETLIKEIHHRVKNNLQVIASLLYLQSTRLADPGVVHMFEESSNRIKSISLIHEKLYKDRLHLHNGRGGVDFGDYVRDLTGALFASYGVDQRSIRLVLDVNNVFLSLDSAVPCGLIINELVSNSLKHAFPGGRPGEVRVTLFGEDDGRITMIVGDNGAGLPPDTDLEKSASLGLRLVKMLAQQLGAEVQVNRGRGTEYRFKFTDAARKDDAPPAPPRKEPAGARSGGG